MVGSLKRNRGLIIFGVPIEAKLSVQISRVSIIK